MEGLLFLIIAIVWEAADQRKQKKEAKRRQEERRKSNSNSRFFWKRWIEAGFLTQENKDMSQEEYNNGF